MIKKLKKSECSSFKSAGEFVWNHPEWTLVHGNVFELVDGNPEYQLRAWCEDGDNVFDGKQQRFVDKDTFYQRHRPFDPVGQIHSVKNTRCETRIVCYSGYDATIWMHKHGNYGPWDADIVADTSNIGAKPLVNLLK